MSPPQIVEVSTVGPLQTLAPGAQNRFVVDTHAYEAHSPFVLLVEDFVTGQHDFHMHPHRGIETVTFYLDGAMEHVDHLGTKGVLGAGDVQWMTAGRGIMHGGRPDEGRGVHALQLWLNLPAALKMSPPGTREQRRAQAVARQAPGANLWIYGEPSPAQEEAPWSVWPMTLTDLHLEKGALFDFEPQAGWRTFLHVLSGEVEAGVEHRTLRAGETAWIGLEDLSGGARAVPLRGIEAARLVAYSARPIDEPMVAQGPFVMNSEHEIRQAYADLKDGTFLAPGD